MTDIKKFEEARKWVDSLQERWRLQVLSKRFRINKKTGERTELPTRIRRFVEGVPWALVQDSVDYLLSLAPYTGIIYNGVELEGSYRPTITTWKRDDQDEVNTATSSRRNDGTYTLIQDLVDEANSEYYGAASSVGCSEEVLSEWHWDEVDVEGLPSGGRQGVTYGIASLSRNEDGTFNYSLVKRVAKTQHTGRHTQTDDAVTTVEVDTWNNLYGNPSDGFKDERGNKITIPKATAKGGTRVEVQIQENDDCTYRVAATWTTTKGVEAKNLHKKDQFEEQKSVTKFGQTSKLPAVPEPTGGVIKTHENQLQPDGSYTTVESTETERPVEDSIVEVSVGRKGVRRTVTDRNQTNPAETDEGKISLGGSVRVEKTPGKLYNNTISSWVRSALMRVANVCKIDIFSHTHRTTEAGLSELPEGDVSDSGKDGVVKTRTTQMDEDGSITETLETETETEVKNSKETWSYGLFGRRHRVENQHVVSPLEPPAVSPATVGNTYVNEKTPGGLYNTVEDVLDRTSESIKSGVGCEKTVFEHSDIGVTRDPSGKMPGHVDEAGRGVHHKVSGSLNDDGSVSIQETTTTEKKVTDSDVTFKRTAKAIIEQHTDRNTLEFASKPALAGETVSHTTNPGGTRNVTKTKITLTKGVDHGHCAQDIFTHEHDKVVVTTGTTADSSDTPAPGGGKYYRKDSVVDDDGIVTTTTRTTTENKVVDAEVTYERRARGLITTTMTKASDTAACDPGEDNVGNLSSHRKTQGGRYDVTTRVLTKSAKPDSAFCQKTVFEHVHDTVEMSTGSIPEKFDAPDAGIARGTGIGEYSEWSSSMDNDGFVKTVKRLHKEIRTEGGYGGTANMLSHTKTTVTKNRSDTELVPDSYDAGIGIKTVSATRNPGGTYDVTVTEEKPTGLKDWTATSKDSDLVKIMMYGFCNMHKEEFESKLSGKIKDTAVEWIKNPVKGVLCSNVKVSFTSSMNKFGLLDGNITVVCEWPPSAVVEPKAEVECPFTILHYNTTPMHNVSEHNGRLVVEVTNQVTKVTRGATFYAGHGVDAFQKLFTGTYYSGTNFSYNVATGYWSGTIVGYEGTEISYSGSREVVM